MKNQFASTGIPKNQRTLKDELAEVKVSARKTKHQPNYILVRQAKTNEKGSNETV